MLGHSPLPSVHGHWPVTMTLAAALAGGACSSGSTASHHIADAGVPIDAARATDATHPTDAHQHKDGTSPREASHPDAAVATVPLAKDSPWPKFRGNARQDGLGTVKPTNVRRNLLRLPDGKGRLQLARRRRRRHRLRRLSGPELLRHQPRRHAALEGRDGRDHRLGRPAGRPGTRLLRVGRRTAPRLRCRDRRRALDLPGRPSERDRRLHRLVRGERRHRPQGHALRPRRQLPALRRRPCDGSGRLELRHARPDLVAPRGRPVERHAIRRQQRGPGLPRRQHLRDQP